MISYSSTMISYYHCLLLTHTTCRRRGDVTFFATAADATISIDRKRPGGRSSEVARCKS